MRFLGCGGDGGRGSFLLSAGHTATCYRGLKQTHLKTVEMIVVSASEECDCYSVVQVGCPEEIKKSLFVQVTTAE